MAVQKGMFWVSLGILLWSVNAGCETLPDKQHVVIQVSEDDVKLWNLALNNAQNFQQAVGKDQIEVEIVAFGPGLNMLKFDSEVANRLTAADKEGVMLRACGTTMKKANVTEKDLHSGAKVVPSGVVEIMNKQNQGWRYLRP
jgi:intracellular sulfur oxidation DsrE/DsrF family protein